VKEKRSGKNQAGQKDIGRALPTGTQMGVLPTLEKRLKKREKTEAKKGATRGAGRRFPKAYGG